MASNSVELEKMVWASAFANAYFWNKQFATQLRGDEALIRSHSAGHAREALLAFREAAQDFGKEAMLPSALPRELQ